MREPDRRTQRIRNMNDLFRQTMVGGRIMATPGVAHDSQLAGKVLDAVRVAEIDRANDPYDEHDFVAVEVEGERYYAKIDYYNKAMDGGSEDPADPEQTVRVMTIMRADEY